MYTTPQLWYKHAKPPLRTDRDVSSYNENGQHKQFSTALGVKIETSRCEIKIFPGDAQNLSSLWRESVEEDLLDTGSWKGTLRTGLTEFVRDYLRFMLS